MTDQPGEAASAYSALQKIESGAWDRFLIVLGLAIRARSKEIFKEGERIK
jgi:hypothetical protein